MVPERASNPEVVECCGLRKAFGVQGVLAAFDWEVSAGSFALLAGPPGAGKTTVLRILAGFSAPEGGEARLFGRECACLPLETRQRFAWAPEVTGFPTWMRARELAAKHRDLYPSFDTSRCARVCEALEVSLDERVAALSDRDRQSLGIALALAQQAELAFLDEPFAGLDGARGAGLEGALGEVAAEGSTTLVATTSSIGSWTRLCDTLCVLRGGRSVLFGAIEELCAAAREIVLPLERYVQVASSAQRAGVITSRTDELVRSVTVASFPEELAALVGGIEGARVQAVDLARLYAAAIDVSSTGTGSAPE